MGGVKALASMMRSISLSIYRETAPALLSRLLGPTELAETFNFDELGWADYLSQLKAARPRPTSNTEYERMCKVEVQGRPGGRQRGGAVGG